MENMKEVKKLNFFQRINKRWKEGTVSQKSSMLISLVVFLLTIFIVLYWISESLSYKYRYNYRSNNKIYWEKLNSKEITENTNRRLSNDGITSEWGIHNNYLHFFFNKIPDPIDFTNLIISIWIVTSLITGGNGAVSGIKNFQLPKNVGEKMPNKQIYRAWFYFICWIILLTGAIAVKRFITAMDPYTNTKIPIPEEIIMGGLGTIIVCLSGSNILVKITKTISSSKGIEEVKGEENIENKDTDL